MTDLLTDLSNVSANAAQSAAFKAAIGATVLFDTVADATSATILSNVNALQTAGFWAEGDGGGALYKRAGSPPSFGGWFQSSDGAYWLLSEGVVRAEMFGATSAIGDHTSAIQDFFDYVTEVRVDKAVLAGDLSVSDTVTLDGALDESITSHYEFSATITATAPMENILEIINLVAATFTGRPHVIALGSEPYLDRDCMNCVLISYCSGCTFDGFYVENAYADGVRVERQPTNNNVTHLGSIYSKRCGSGYVAGGTDTSLVGSFTIGSNSGSANSFGQRTTLNVSVTPDAYIDETERCVVAHIGGELYQVMSINRGGGTIEIYPWINSGFGAGTITYMYGKTLGIYGTDSNVMGATLVSALRGGGAVELSCLYGPTIDRVLAEATGLGITIGQSVQSQVFGGFVGQIYGEGNTADILAVGISNYGFTFGAQSAFDADNAKVKLLYPVRDGSNNLSKDGLVGVNLISQDGIFFREKRGSAATSGSLTLDFNRPNKINSVYRSDSLAVTIAALSTSSDRLWGYDGGVLFTVMGTGSRGEPTGSVTFTPPGGTTVNGAASQTWQGFSGPASFSVNFDRSTSVWWVSPLTGLAPEGKFGTTIKGDVNATVTPYADANTVIYSTTLTANRTLSLSSTGAHKGTSWKVIRTAGGAFNLGVQGVKNLNQNQWCIVEWDGAAWILTAAGAL